MSYPQETFTRTSLLAGFLIAQRREVVSANTVLYQLDVLKKTGRYDAFKLKWHPSYDDPPNVWPIPNHLFWDSDIGKWIEGACYFLQEPDAKNTKVIRAAVDELVQMIKSAQQPDGYLNIHYTVVEPGKRFTNLRDFHELYNAGHLIEGALAHHRLYRNDDFLGTMLKYVDLLYRTFGPGDDQVHGYPGHPEIELALLRLYGRTRNPKHLELARYFVTERGNPEGVNGRHYYEVEAEKRGDPAHMRMAYWGREGSCLWYYQAHKPIVEQQTIEGHSVRAMYLLTAVADLVGLDRRQHQLDNDKFDSQSLKDAIYRLWDNMVGRKMYVTGGIGAIKQWEGFGLDYFLPQGTDEGGCYAETCAAIGVMMLAERILQYDLDGRFGDIMELCLYNAVLTAMSHDGTKFTYVNQLASSDEDPSRREEWFTCACCPPNVLRLLGQIGGYIFTQQRRQQRNQHQVNVHLYISSQYELELDDHGEDDQEDTAGSVVLTQKTNWPWSGKVEFHLDMKRTKAQVSLALRIPAWAKKWQLTPTPPTPTTVEKGYLLLPASWVSQNPSFTLDIQICAGLVAPHPYANQDTLTLTRGPIVYCVEDVDNPWVEDHFKSVQLDPACSVHEKTVTDTTTGTGDTYVALTVQNGARRLQPNRISATPGVPVNDNRELDQMDHENALIDELNFVPYYFRANRDGRGQARVGLRRWHK